ncbi:MAG: replication-associated recombination protein A [bacterium]
MQTLFTQNKDNRAENRPLADRMRPESIDEFFGQTEAVGIIKSFIQKDNIPSMIFWGPPGTGKTTIAHIIAKKTKSYFLSLSAVTSNIPEVKKKIAEAADRLTIYGQKTIFFVDEIHRFNKLQQDAFLPHVENGTIILIGATTENPSFEVNSALLSRCKVLVLKRLSNDDLINVAERALDDKKKGLGNFKLELSKDGMDYLINYADGDARRVLNLLEEVVSSPSFEEGVRGRFSTVGTVVRENEGTRDAADYGEARPEDGGSREVAPSKDPPAPHSGATPFKKAVNRARRITAATLSEISQRSALLYDKKGEEHYNLISALHKSMRDSDPDASLYWLARMLEAGEDGLYIARRLIRFASEDIGNSDFRALLIANAAKDAFHFMGRGEGDLALAQAVVYLAKAPKNNELYIAYGKVKKDIEEFGSLPVPMHLRNASTKLMKDLGYGAGYKYAHNYEDAKVDQDHFPKEMGKRSYFGRNNTD